MLDVYTVSFFGHRHIDRFMEVECRMEKIIRELLLQRDYVEFLVGRNGEFDQIAASVIRHAKRTVRVDNSSLVLVLPYVTAEFLDNQSSFEEYYDHVEVCESAELGHFKAAIQTRNRGMVDRSDLVICCIEHKRGGAYQTIKYAEKRGKTIINLAGNEQEP